MNDVEIVQSECSEYLDSLEDESLDACITDPPYEIGMMSKEWDRSGISFDPKFWEKVKRVLKPGAHIAVFGGSRTFHRIAIGIEDAGFEIRDTIDFVYGTGFPKNHDVSKAIDKMMGKERTEVIGKRKRNVKPFDDNKGWNKNNTSGDYYYRAPVTDQAKKWDGWGSSLKPAREPIIIARKPLEGTIAENVLEYGTGAINIDDCRISVDSNDENIRENYKDHVRKTGSIWGSASGAEKDFTGDRGRFPANIIIDKWAAEKMDEQSGECYSGSAEHGSTSGVNSIWGSGEGDVNWKNLNNSAHGGASRYFKQISYHPIDTINFFYCSKPSKKERNIGCENTHVTIKPVELMAYLTRLLTPKNGKVIDPFAGSGTTGIAALMEGFDSILIEKEEKYVDICKKRIDYSIDNYREVYKMIYDNPSNTITKKAANERETIKHNFWE